MIKKLSSTGLHWLWITIAIFAMDRITKSLALHYLTVYEPYPVMRFFNFTLVFNKGAAFSFLHSASGWQMWFFGILSIVVSVGILIWLKRLSYQQRWLSISLTLILGGALGNLFDRIYYGHVIDFIDWYVSYYHWPVFNIADSAVCVGAVMLFLDTMMGRKKLE